MKGNCKKNKYILSDFSGPGAGPTNDAGAPISEVAKREEEMHLDVLDGGASH